MFEVIFLFFHKESDRGCYMCQLNTEEMKKQIGCIDVLSK